MSLLRSALLLTLAVSLGCAHPVERRDWSDFDGPGAEYFQAERVFPPEFPDPVEPWNRGAGIFNHGLLVGIVSPLARGYRFVVPESVRERIQKSAVNLVYPRRLVANLLQGNFSEAGDATLRFLTNTTVGAPWASSIRRRTGASRRPRIRTSAVPSRRGAGEAPPRSRCPSPGRARYATEWA